jgi:hypothetical protein
MFDFSVLGTGLPGAWRQKRLVGCGSWFEGVGLGQRRVRFMAPDVSRNGDSCPQQGSNAQHKDDKQDTHGQS